MQHVAIEVGRLLGTAAQPFANITAFDGVLVQGTVAEEGEISSAHNLNINAILCHNTIKPFGLLPVHGHHARQRH